MKLFMRILQIFFIFLIINFIATLIVIKFVDVNKYKNFFEDKLTQQLDRKVAIENISLKFSLSDGVKLELKDLQIENLMDVASSQVVFDVVSFIKTQTMIVEEIKFVRPNIQIRASEHIQSTQEQGSKDVFGNESKDVFAKDSSGSATEAAAEIPEIGIRKLEIQDGTFTYIDDVSAVPSTIQMYDVDVTVDKFAFDQLFTFTLDGGVWADRQNVRLQGQANIKRTTQAWELAETHLSIDLGTIVLKQMIASHSALAGLKDIDFVRGQIKLSINRMTSADDPLKSLQAKVSMENGSLKLASLKAPIEDLQLQTSLDGDHIYFDKARFSLAGGSGVLDGRLEHIYTIPVYNVQINLENVDIAKLVDQSEWPVALMGKIQTHLTVDGNGFSEQQLTQSLKGKGTVEMMEGRLKDFNWLQTVLQKLSFMPNVVDKLSTKYKDKLNEKDTLLNKSLVDFGIVAGNIVFSKTEVSTEDFIFSGKGSMDFNQLLDFTSTFYITGNFAAELMQAGKEFEYFANSNKQIVIPLRRYQGPADKYVTYPDVKDILKSGLRQKASEEAKKAIFKALDVNPSQSNVGEGEPKKQPSAEEVLIENVLDSLGIFK